ncbi:MAG: porin family protein [Legionella sp.]|nr:porin family protein [Legionella sp.]
MRIRLFTACLLSTGIMSASTPIDGWYTGLFLGYTYLPSNISNYTFGVLTDRVSYIDGYNLGGRIGHSCYPLRYEGEYTYLHARPRSFEINNVTQSGISGRSIANLVMANAYYDTYEILPAVTSFLGVGIGYGYLQTSLLSDGPDDFTYFRVSENKFAYQGTLGLTYNFAENYALNIAYRYVGTAGAGNYGEVFQAHLVSIGAIYHFDFGNYK